MSKAETFKDFQLEAARRFPNQPSIRPAAPARAVAEFLRGSVESQSLGSGTTSPENRTSLDPSFSPKLAKA